MQSIVAEKREILGKKTAGLRKKGFLPAVVYGKGQASENITLKQADFLKLWKDAGESTIINLKVNGGDKNVLIHEVAVDPLKDTPVHADFYIVDMSKALKVDVVLEFIGDSEAVKAGGILVKIMHAVQIEALPKDLPHSIIVDISELKNIEDKIKVSDLNIPPGVKVLDEPGETVVMAEAPRAEEVVEEAAPSLETIEKVGDKEKEEKAAVAASAEAPPSKADKSEKK